MSKILILTNPNDEHSFTIAPALERKGAEVTLWHPSDLPQKQRGSILNTGGDVSLSLIGPRLDVSDSRFDTVWFRRPIPAVLPANLHESDKHFAKTECHSFCGTILRMMTADAFWVNPLEALPIARSKMLQLSHAQRAGLEVPPTLLSNNPSDIRKFLRVCGGTAVFKTHTAPMWRLPEGRMAALYTSVVSEPDLPDDASLMVAPALYQPLIEKAYELRVTVIGRRLFAAKLLSQETTGGLVDFRAAYHELKVEPTTISDQLTDSLFSLMDSLNLVFGCIDLIVTPDDKVVFLEVNEMGQFLWIESMTDGKIPLVDAFAEFLIQGTADYYWEESDRCIRLAEVEPEGLRRRKEEFDEHVFAPDTRFDETGNNEDALPGKRSWHATQVTKQEQ